MTQQATIYRCQEPGCCTSLTIRAGAITTANLKTHHNKVMQRLEVDQHQLDMALAIHIMYCMTLAKEEDAQACMTQISDDWDELSFARQDFFLRFAAIVQGATKQGDSHE